MRQNKLAYEENKSKESTNITSDTYKWIKRKFFIDSVIAICIAITPILFYLYEQIPEEANSWQFLFFKIERGLFRSVQIACWVYLSKIIPLLLLVLWFITCKHWWYHTILIPMAMYAFQLFNAMNKTQRYIDEIEIYWVIPIMVCIIPFVYIIRLKLFDKLVNGIDLKEIERELEEYKKREQKHSL